MSTTIQQGLRPLFLTCFIMGLDMYSLTQLNKSRFHRWIAYLSILYCLAIWSVYSYVIFYMFVTFFSLKIFFFRNITIMVISAIQYFTAIVSTILIIYHQKKFQIYMKKLAAVDDTLEKLGTPKTYKKLHMLSKRVIIGWIVHSIIKNIGGITWWLTFVNNSGGTFLFPIMNHPININEFTDLLFIFLLWYIGTRFDKIIDHMRCLLLKGGHGLKYMWKKPVIIHGYFLHRYNYKRTFWTLMHLHLELCRIARELNIIFGIQITFGMMMYFAYLTSHCYYLWRVLEQKHQDERSLQLLIGLCLWCFSCSIRLYATNHICESVKNKANNIDKIIHQLTNTLQCVDIWKEVDFFVLQVMQHSLKFTGLGLFYLGDKFLQKFSTTIVTFVIIMIQLNMQFLS